MLAARCATCGRRTLVDVSDFVAMRRLDRGMEVAYNCSCGSIGTWRSAGRAA